MSLSISNSFTPFPSLLGGAIVGLAADVLLLGNGDIMGAAGICTQLLLNPIQTLREPSQRWKLVYAASFLTTSTFALAPYYYNSTENTSAGNPVLSTVGYALAGLFVGFGTKLGNGCTSGHGICGLGRLSKRSLAAVMTFLPAGIITTTLLTQANREVSSSNRLLVAIQSMLWNDSGAEGSSSSSSWAGTVLSLASLAAAAVATYMFKNNNKSGKEANASAEKDNKSKLVPAGISGALFAIGLYISKMVYQSKVYGFLRVTDLSTSEGWDPSLMMVMGGGVVLSFIAYQFIDKFRVIGGNKDNCLKHPVALSDNSGNFNGVPTNTKIDWQLLLGEACFGIGWGIGGLCPGPAMFAAGIGSYDNDVLAYWWPGYVVGAYVANEIKKKIASSKTTTKKKLTSGAGGGSSPLKSQ